MPKPAPDLLSREVERRLRELGARPGDRLLVACSGGADSLVLLHLLAGLRSPGGRRRFPLAAAHLDHGVRGGDGARAAGAVEEECRGLRVPFVRGSLDPAAVAWERAKVRSLEGALRTLRYRFLGEAALSARARWVLTAHQADDLAETVLMRAAAGKDWRSLGGIPAARGAFLRPLLGAPREAILGWAAARGLRPDHDPTNLDPAFARNRARHAVLPALARGFHPGIGGLLARLGAAAGALAAFEDRALGPRGKSGPARGEILSSLPPALREGYARRVLHRWLRRRPSRAQVEAFLRLARKGQGEQEVKGGSLLAGKGLITFRKGKPPRHRQGGRS